MPDQADARVEKSKKVFIVIVFILKPYDYAFAFDCACTYVFVAWVNQPENDMKLTGRVF